MYLRRLFEADLKLHQLRTLVAFKKLGQVQKVADTLHVTQPAISKQLKELELAVGVRLFDRRGNKLGLTVAGERLARLSYEILHQLMRAEIEIKALAQGLAGTLVIGTVTTSAQTLVSQSILRFKELAPAALVKLVEGTADELLDMLKREDIDIAVVRGIDVTRHQGNAVATLLDDPLMICCRVDHPLALKSKLSWSDLSDVAWVTPIAGSPAYQAFSELLRRHQLSMAVSVESISITANIAMLSSSEMVGLLPLSAARILAQEHRVSILDLHTENLLASVTAHWRSDDSNPLTPILVACLEETASLQSGG